MQKARAEKWTLCSVTPPSPAAGTVAHNPDRETACFWCAVLECASPASVHAYQSRPSVRLETFEKKDTLAPGGRSFGPDKRLVVPSRSAAPRFKVLLFPHRQGDPLPVTNWNAARTEVSVQWPRQQDTAAFAAEDADGRTRVTLSRDGEADRVSIA